MDQSALIEQLFAEIKALKERMLVLEKENTFLREKLSKYENPKNSRNSSVPPSKDENRTPKTKSLREQSDRKVGGQKGHEGNTLKMTQTPDEIITYTPNFCGKCGSDIHELQAEFIGKRQVIDIPVVQPFYVEHQVYKKTCSCGHSKMTWQHSSLLLSIMVLLPFNLTSSLDFLTLFWFTIAGKVTFRQPLKIIKSVLHTYFVSSIILSKYIKTIG